MQVRRYFARSAREALRELKEELGSDAIVLSNRAVEGGVEILALPADALSEPKAAAVAPRPASEPARPAPAASLAEDEFRRSLSKARSRQQTQPSVEAPRTVRPFTPPRVEASEVHMPARQVPQRPVDHDLFVEAAPRARRIEPAAARRSDDAPREPAPARRPAAATMPNVEAEARIRELQATNEKLMGELGGIRSMIERQLAGFAWGEVSRNAPARTRLMAELLEAGFSAELARRIADGGRRGRWAASSGAEHRRPVRRSGRDRFQPCRRRFGWGPRPTTRGHARGALDRQRIQSGMLLAAV